MGMGITAMLGLGVLVSAVFCVFFNKDILSASGLYNGHEEDSHGVSTLDVKLEAASETADKEQSGAKHQSGSGSKDLGEANDDDGKEKDHKPESLTIMAVIIAIFCITLVTVTICCCRCGKMRRRCRRYVVGRFLNSRVTVSDNN